MIVMNQAHRKFLNLFYENKDNIHKVKFYFKVLKIKQQSQSLLNDVIWPPTNLQNLSVFLSVPDRCVFVKMLIRVRPVFKNFLYCEREDLSHSVCEVGLWFFTPLVCLLGDRISITPIFLGMLYFPVKFVIDLWHILNLMPPEFSTSNKNFISLKKKKTI